MRPCRQCGAPIGNHIQLCPECGFDHQLPVEASPNASDDSNAVDELLKFDDTLKFWLVLLVGVSVLLPGIICGFASQSFLFGLFCELIWIAVIGFVWGIASSL